MCIVMNDKRQEKIINEAREWIGTPWRHCQCRKQVSCDCVGFVVGVFSALGFPVKYDNYKQKPIGDELYREYNKWLIEKPINDMAVGDVILFRIMGEVIHSAILSHLSDDGFWYLHCDDRPGVRQVVEVPLNRNWHKRIAYCFYVPI